MGTVNAKDYKPAVSRDAEMSILGGILMNNSALHEAEQIIRVDDFFYRHHQIIYSRMLFMDSERQPIDLVTLSQSLSDANQLESANGAPYLASLADGMPKVANIGHYARIVREKSDARKLAWLGQSAIDGAQGRNLGELLEEVESGLQSIRERDISSKGMTRIGDVIKDSMPVIEKIKKGEGVIIGTPTGYHDLDQKIAGWVSGEFVIVAARPSEGKTAFALEAARRQAEMNNAVAIWSLEMSREALMFRIACQAARVSGHLLRIGRLSAKEWERFYDGLALVSQLPIWIDDSPVLMAHRVRSSLRTMAQRHNIKLAIVDYLQLVRAKGENRTQEVTNISISLKAAARDLGNISGGTLMALSQLSRTRAGQIPRLSDLRESGQIEQDSDTVMFIYNDPEAQIVPGQISPWRKVLDVAKQRNGPLGTIDFTWFPPTMEFRPASSGFDGVLSGGESESEIDL